MSKAIRHVQPQKEGINYKETSSLISLKNSLELHRKDIKTLFHNGDIEETIYI